MFCYTQCETLAVVLFHVLCRCMYCTLKSRQHFLWRLLLLRTVCTIQQLAGETWIFILNKVEFCDVTDARFPCTSFDHVRQDYRRCHLTSVDVRANVNWLTRVY